MQLRKKSNELLAYSYAKLYNIPSTGLRFFTVYGPAGRPDMAYLVLQIHYVMVGQFKNFLTTAIVSVISPISMIS